MSVAVCVSSPPCTRHPKPHSKSHSIFWALGMTSGYLRRSSGELTRNWSKKFSKKFPKKWSKKRSNFFFSDSIFDPLFWSPQTWKELLLKKLDQKVGSKIGSANFSTEKTIGSLLDHFFSSRFGSLFGSLLGPKDQTNWIHSSLGAPVMWQMIF